MLALVFFGCDVAIVFGRVVFRILLFSVLIRAFSSVQQDFYAQICYLFLNLLSAFFAIENACEFELLQAGRFYLYHLFNEILDCGFLGVLVPNEVLQLGVLLPDIAKHCLHDLTLLVLLYEAI